jgi:hypothetical protein
MFGPVLSSYFVFNTTTGTGVTTRARAKSKASHSKKKARGEPQAKRSQASHSKKKAKGTSKKKSRSPSPTKKTHSHTPPTKKKTRTPRPPLPGPEDDFNVLNKPNRRKLKRVLQSLCQKQSILFTTREDWPSVKGFYVLVNEMRPNQGGANPKDESRKRQNPQIIVLGGKEDGPIFFDTLNPTDVSDLTYCHTVDDFFKTLMEDGDPANDEDGSKSKAGKTTTAEKEVRELNERVRELEDKLEESERLKSKILSKLEKAKEKKVKYLDIARRLYGELEDMKASKKK